MTDRNALRQLTYGMYVVSATSGGRINGQVSNTVFQVTSEPPVVCISLNKQNRTHGMVAGSGSFTVSVLDITAPLTLIGLFGFRHGNEVDKFASLPHRLGANGAPYLTEHSAAFLEAKVIGRVDEGTHTMFLGEVTRMGMLEGGEPMTYDYYHRVLKGVTPQTAPTYMPRTAQGGDVRSPGPPLAATWEKD